MSETKIIEEQLEFFRRSRAGCKFAALAATDPPEYGWLNRMTRPDLVTIETEIASAIATPDITTVSLIFPSVSQAAALVELIQEVRNGTLIFLQQDVVFEGFRCLGLRIRVGELLSWVSGFGPFDFLPVTRQCPHTAIIFRVKPRPNYEWVLKPSPDGVIHLADMDMRGLSEDMLWRMWDTSFSGTEQILGRKPDIRSAAKTTFAIPESLIAGLEQ